MHELLAKLENVRLLQNNQTIPGLASVRVTAQIACRATERCSIQAVFVRQVVSSNPLLECGEEKLGAIQVLGVSLLRFNLANLFMVQPRAVAECSVRTPGVERHVMCSSRSI